MIRFVSDPTNRNKSSMKALAILLLLAAGWAPSYANDFKALEAACKEGKPSACNNLGFAYQQSGRNYDAAKAYEKGCTLGEPMACSNLAELFYDGSGVKQDLIKAMRLWKVGCDGGVVSGCAGLCILQSDAGSLTPQRTSICKGQLKAACNEGNTWMCGREIVAQKPKASNPDVCEGEDLTRTKELVNGIWDLAGSADQNDLMASLGTMISGIEKFNRQAESLPQPCQILIQQWGAAMGAGSTGGGGSSSGPTCMGGVCCDGTGCY